MYEFKIIVVLKVFLETVYFQLVIEFIWLTLVAYNFFYNTQPCKSQPVNFRVNKLLTKTIVMSMVILILSTPQ